MVDLPDGMLQTLDLLDHTKILIVLVEHNLNHSVLRDGWWYQDYSYLLSTGGDVDDYADILLGLLHPAGLRVFFEKTLSDYEPVGEDVDEGIGNGCEVPVIGNYLGYPINGTGRSWNSVYRLFWFFGII